MTKDEKKKRLLNFLDKKAFDPISQKNDFGSDQKKEQFQEVKEKTEKEKERFHNYKSPEI